MQMFAQMGLSAYPCDVALFGENVKRLRKVAGLTQEALATALAYAKPTPISLMETTRANKVPRPETIKKIAAALQVHPSRLLEGVETEYDVLRADPAHQNKDRALTSPVTGHGVQQGNRKSASGGTSHAGASSSPSRVLERDFDAIVAELFAASVRCHEVAAEAARQAADFHTRAERIAELIEGDVSDPGAAALEPPKGRRPPVRSGLHETRKRSKGRKHA